VMLYGFIASQGYFDKIVIITTCEPYERLSVYTYPVTL
jgi:hypothetical protein